MTEFDQSAWDYDPKELENKSPAELSQRRAEIVSQISALPRAHEDAPTRLLQELAFITGALRRKTAGPPKVTKPTKRGGTAPPATTDDLLGMIGK